MELFFASTENEPPSEPLNNSENAPFAEHPIVKSLMEAVDELMETIEAYMEQVDFGSHELHLPDADGEEDEVEVTVTIPPILNQFLSTLLALSTKDS